MNFLQISLHHYLVISVILFALGIFAVLTRRNAIAILMGIELILNSCNINFIAFSHYITGNINGQMFAIFVIMLAAAEAAVALAIIIAIYQRFRTISPDETNSLKG
jgi:NADH-quinone oxidoreductase subunit K